MTNSRLITRFTGNGDIYFSDYDGLGPLPAITLPRAGGSWAGDTLFWMSDDGSTTANEGDFLAMLKDALDSATGDVWDVDIVGVGKTAAGYADGRLYLKNDAANEFTLDPTNGAFTLDERILGLDGSTTQTSSGGELYSVWCHRYGWYPQQPNLEHDIRVLAKTDVHYTSARYPNGTDDGEYETIVIGWDRVHSALCTTYDASLASATDENLVAGDLNCAFERWCLDLARDTTKRWRYYADITAHTASDFKGPYAFGSNSSLWNDPLLSAPITERAGKRRTVQVDGLETGT